MSTALVSANSRVLVEINELRNELDRIVSLPELREATNRLKGLEAYAKARHARVECQKVAEARIWTERRAGEVAKADGRKAEELGVAVNELTRWMRLARIPAEIIEDAIERMLARGGELSVAGVDREVAKVESPTSDPGVFQLPDGRYRIYWKRGGERYSKTLGYGMPLSQAKGALTRARRAERVMGQGVEVKTGQLSKAYSLVRQALWALDYVTRDSEIPADARAAADSAIAFLHAAEDALVEARKLS